MNEQNGKEKNNSAIFFNNKETFIYSFELSGRFLILFLKTNRKEKNLHKVNIPIYKVNVSFGSATLHI